MLVAQRTLCELFAPLECVRTSVRVLVLVAVGRSAWPIGQRVSMLRCNVSERHNNRVIPHFLSFYAVCDFCFPARSYVYFSGLDLYDPLQKS